MGYHYINLFHIICIYKNIYLFIYFFLFIYFSFIYIYIIYIYTNAYSRNLFRIFSDSLPSNLSDMYLDVLSGILTDMYSDSLLPIWRRCWHFIWHSISQVSWHPIWHISWHSVWHILWHSIWDPIWHVWRLRPGSAHWHRELALKVRQCPLRSTVEVHQCPLRSGTDGWGPAVTTDSYRELALPAVPTANESWQRSGRRRRKEKEGEGRRRKEKEGEGRRRVCTRTVALLRYGLFFCGCRPRSGRAVAQKHPSL